MTVIKFHVEGLPPKKNGANSMWGSEHESKRLVSLRRAALLAMNGRPTFKSKIKLTVKVYVGAKNNPLVGDLDTFITGICDGLMKANPKCNLCVDVWSKVEKAIQPDQAVAIEDDYQVIGIKAAKIEDNTGSQSYDVILEGE